MKDVIFDLIKKEEKRQKDVLEMIPSENYASKEVREAVGSVLMNKYSEGYPHKRYYQGNKIADLVEDLAIERAKKLFGAKFVNVQPYSGSPANSAVYFALLEPGDKIMGLELASGGHLTHGHPKITFSGKYFNSVQYKVKTDGWIDYEEVLKMALAEKPKIIVCGGTAYPRIWDFKKFGEIAKKAGALLLADISHITGLIIGGVHLSPFPYADVVMTTTHKTLRGSRGAILMTNNEEIAEKIDKSVFPGLQGGPHDNVTAGIAVCLHEASTPKFKKYAEQIVKNSKVLAEELIKYGFKLVTDGTDNHLILIDLQNFGVNGRIYAESLEMAGIVANRNSVPGDPMPPFYPSGVRLGTPAITTRGMKEKEMKKIAKWYFEVLEEVKDYRIPEKEKRQEFMKDFRKKVGKNIKLGKIEREVAIFCKKFPVP